VLTAFAEFFLVILVRAARRAACVRFAVGATLEDFFDLFAHSRELTFAEIGMDEVAVGLACGSLTPESNRICSSFGVAFERDARLVRRPVVAAGAEGRISAKCDDVLIVCHLDFSFSLEKINNFGRLKNLK
jgi:hypothetical protein